MSACDIEKLRMGLWRRVNPNPASMYTSQAVWPGLVSCPDPPISAALGVLYHHPVQAAGSGLAIRIQPLSNSRDLKQAGSYLASYNIRMQLCNLIAADHDVSDGVTASATWASWQMFDVNLCATVQQDLSHELVYLS